MTAARAASRSRWETPRPLHPWTLPAAASVLSAGAPREDWLAARRSMIGGSDIAKMVNASPYGDAFTVWLEKTGRVPLDDEATNAQLRGQILEDGVVDLWVARYAEFPIEVRRQGLVRSRKHPHAGATVDRLSICPAGRCLVEVKTSADVRDWTNEQGEPEVPASVQLQGQWQLGVTGRDHIHYICLGPRLVPFDRLMDRDEELIAHLFATVDQWWDTFVVADVPPPASGQSLALIRQLYGNPDKGKPYVLTDEDVELFRSLAPLKADMESAKQNYDDTLAQLQARIGDATEVLWSPDPVDVAATWRATKTIDGCDREFVAAHRDLVEPFVDVVEVEKVDVARLVAANPDLIASHRLRYRRQWRAK